MAKFAYNNVKHTYIQYTSFKFNCRYQPRVSYNKNVDPYFSSKVANELTKELRNLMTVCREKLQHAQKQQKRAYNKGTKPRSYVPSEKF